MTNSNPPNPPQTTTTVFGASFYVWLVGHGAELSNLDPDMHRKTLAGDFDSPTLMWIDLKTLEQAFAALIRDAKIEELKHIPIRSTEDPLDDTKLFWWHAYNPQEIEDRIRQLTEEVTDHE